MRTLLTLLSALVLVAPSSAQNNSTIPHFEVASIKPVAFPNDAFFRGFVSAGGTCGLPAVERTGSRVAVRAGSLCGLIRVAYDVSDFQVVGIPQELTTADATNFFQIEGRTGDGPAPTMDATRVMLRMLLDERFQLRVHHESRVARVYELTVAKGGPRNAACSNPDAPSVYSSGLLVSCKPPLPMARLAQMLSRETDRPVVDRTGLGSFAFELRWLPEGAQAQPDSPPGLFTAIQEQVGLKLEPQREPVDTIVVDRAARPEPN